MKIELTDREKDIIKLCDAVLNISTDFYDNPNGAYESTCMFCRKKVKKGGNEGCIQASMDEIKHEPNCAYLIAKDLSTNLL